MAQRLCAVLLILASANVVAGDVWVIEVEGAIGPASADFFMRTLEDAEDAGVHLVVMRLDTPGGLDSSMRDMIKAILASKVPIATYVAPNGSRAASAGTYIMYASHIAAMAPATNIGSSTPVTIGGGGSPLPFPASEPPKDPDDEKPGDSGADEEASDGGAPEPKTAMERKVINDAVAYIQGLAKLRGRNEHWAEETVRMASNLNAIEALEANVIDYVAEDIADLLAQIDGIEVDVAGGTVEIDTGNASVEYVEPDWRHELLAVITDPNVAYILLMIGIYGLIIEFYNPGLGVGGVIGIICLLLGAYALQMLPINYAGLALIIVGLGLLIAEAFSPSFGILGTGGVVAFLIGSLILIDTDVPAYQISIPIVLAFAVASAGLLIFALGAAITARRTKVVTGSEGMIGEDAEVLHDFTGRGRVRAFGEVWQAMSDEPLTQGEIVTVTAVDGLKLAVRKLAVQEKEH